MNLISQKYNAYDVLTIINDEKFIKIGSHLLGKVKKYFKTNYPRRMHTRHFAKGVLGIILNHLSTSFDPLLRVKNQYFLLRFPSR